MTAFGTGESLLFPLELSVSELKLNALFVLEASKHKGLTLTFKNEPMESLKISSSLDGIPGIGAYLRDEIGRMAKEAVAEELPKVLHDQSVLILKEYGFEVGVGSRRPSAAKAGVSVSNPTSPTTPNRRASDLAPIPESQVLDYPHHPSASVFSDSASVRGHTRAFSVCQSTTSTHRFPSMVRSRFGSTASHHLPNAKRMEILRRQHSSFSPFDVGTAPAILHRTMTKGRQNELGPSNNNDNKDDSVV